MQPWIAIGVGAAVFVLVLLVLLRRGRPATPAPAPEPGAKPPEKAPAKAEASKDAPPPAAAPDSTTAAPAAKSLPSVADGDEQEGTKVASVPPPPQAVLVHTKIEAGVDLTESSHDRNAARMILVTATGRSDPGRKRKHNEDSFLVRQDHDVFVIADGMGGYAAGEVASQLAIDVFTAAFETSTFAGKPTEGLPRSGDEMVRAIRMANRAILEQAQKNEAMTRMGTTVVACRFSPDRRRVYVAHVGDSRCYRLRDGALQQMTTDHTLGAMGISGPSAAKLSRAVGVADEVEVDVTIDAPRVGDTYLLCSDGLSRMVPDEMITSITLEAPELQTAVDRLIATANERGGRDNITVILVQVRAPEEATKPAPSTRPRPMPVPASPLAPKASASKPKRT